MDSEIRGGGGGYSPPAWRRLGNGDRSSGFWRKGGDNLLGYGGLPPDLDYDSLDECDEDVDLGEDEEDDILAAAIRTRLPTGSMSPEKERSPEPEWRGMGGGIGNGGGVGRFQSRRGGAPVNGHGDVRVKSEEPDAEDMKATLAALPPHKDESENCKFSLKDHSRIATRICTNLTFVFFQISASPFAPQSSNDPNPSKPSSPHSRTSITPQPHPTPQSSSPSSSQF